jgi:hypothetical protein
MIEATLHALGLCSDAHTHPDLIDILIVGGGSATLYFQYKYNQAKLIWQLIISSAKRQAKNFTFHVTDRFKHN